jgi:murein DD-endopeptidase MepM/ murein hydrolase activator NlpD
MYNDQRRSAGQLVIAALAIFGLGWLVLHFVQPTNPGLSPWVSKSMGANAAAASGGLTGITTNQVGQGMTFYDLNRPQGNPLQSERSVVTQGYGVGSHAPANTWGAIDLAIDGNGDGRADPDGTLGQPVYATHAGVVKLARDTWPAGNHIWVSNGGYRTGYSHLQGFAVDDGQEVQPGALIGYIGATGSSSGPHLDYQVWEQVNGQWVNRNPYDFGGADGAK